MPYRYLEEVALADVAFEATGATVEELFAAAGEATMNVMVEELAAIRPLQGRTVRLDEEDLETLLFQYLQELIYLKDAEQLLLRAHRLQIARGGEAGGYSLRAELRGERLDPRRHRLVVDVKAVTLHMFRLQRTSEGWRATVVLDV